MILTSLVAVSENNVIGKDNYLIWHLPKDLKHIENPEKAFIIGGAEIFNLTMSIVNRIEITYVHHTFEGDTFFADLKKEDWKLEWSKKYFKDEKHKYDFAFARYESVLK